MGRSLSSFSHLDEILSRQVHELPALVQERGQFAHNRKISPKLEKRHRPDGRSIRHLLTHFITAMTTGEVVSNSYSPYQVANHQYRLREERHVTVPFRSHPQESHIHSRLWQSWYSTEPNPSPVARMTTINADEMETLQMLSDQYQPQLEGPLVGEKKPMLDLMAEYAHADPTYVAKTASLAATHSTYRAIKGDGQCGWRAAVFGYFETLLQIGNPAMISEEKVRLGSFEETMRMAGIDAEMLEDMFESTWELFQTLQHSVEAQNKDGKFLLDVFNEENSSNFILYHFKTMTSAFMQMHADAYEAFAQMPMEKYRATRIDPANQEIDQIGLQALTDGVIGPAGIALEVSYLDRSVGDSVTPHPFVPNATGWPTIRLLYRPGHYDMIYKSGHAPVRVMLQHHLTPFNTTIGSHPPVIDLELHSYIFPDAAINPVSLQPGPPTDGSHPTYEQQTCMQMYEADYQQYFVSGYAPRPAFEQSTPLPPRWHHPPMAYAVPQSHSPATVSTHSHADSPAGARSSPAHSHGEVVYRKTIKQHELDQRGHESIPLMTGPFKSSPHNQAHFLNTNFQPFMWDPEEEYFKS